MDKIFFSIKLFCTLFPKVFIIKLIVHASIEQNYILTRYLNQYKMNRTGFNRIKLYSHKTSEWEYNESYRFQSYRVESNKIIFSLSIRKNIK